MQVPTILSCRIVLSKPPEVSFFHFLISDFFMIRIVSLNITVLMISVGDLGDGIASSSFVKIGVMGCEGNHN